MVCVRGLFAAEADAVTFPLAPERSLDDGRASLPLHEQAAPATKAPHLWHGIDEGRQRGEKGMNDEGKEED